MTADTPHPSIPPTAPATPPALPPRPRRLRRWPDLLAWAVLAAVAAWGHHTGWRAPAFRELLGAPAPAADGWCHDHGVPAAQCITCHPELAGDNAADWCKEHGMPESRCTACHPEILKTGVAEDWCREHGVPESCCTLCHPDLARLASGAEPEGDGGPDVFGAPADAAPPATPGLDPRTCQKHLLKVQFASVEALAKAGVAVGKVVARPMAEALPAPAEVEYDRTRYAKVLARAAGTVRAALPAVGTAVAAGDLIAVLETGAVGRAKSELLAAHAADAAARAASERIARSAAAGTRSEAERAQAEAVAQAAAVRLHDARQALLAAGLPLPDEAPTVANLARLGLPDGVLDTPEWRRNANLLPVRAPLAGAVIARDAIAGEAVAENQPLATVADTRRMWIRAALPEALAHRARPGARVVFRPQHARDEAADGTVDWIATAVDEATRTVAVRAVVDNPDGRLRAGTFGTAQIVVRPATSVVAVPNAAVQWEGCCHVVFVRLADTVFQVRKVRLGTRDAAYTEVLVGLLPGETVATAGSAVLTASILKSQLGAGCCGEK